jgi:hypothetical protein
VVEDAMSNPFERYDIDPSAGPDAITARMRELIEQADEDERQQLRADWEALTLHPRRRLELALAAFPQTRAPARRPTRPPASAPLRELTMADLCWLPSVAEALDLETTKLPSALPTIEDDPILA